MKWWQVFGYDDALNRENRLFHHRFGSVMILLDDVVCRWRSDGLDDVIFPECRFALLGGKNFSHWVNVPLKTLPHVSQPIGRRVLTKLHWRPAPVRFLCQL